MLDQPAVQPRVDGDRPVSGGGDSGRDGTTDPAMGGEGRPTASEAMWQIAWCFLASVLGGAAVVFFTFGLKAEVLTGVATLGLVVVTAVYARSTSQIARANAETVGATRQLAEETERMATATEAMATATQETLDHLQRPILVLECRAKSGTRVEVHVQNIGEGAAVWPAVYEAVGDGEKGVYVRELHVMGPQQFAMTNWDPQLFWVELPGSAETVRLRAECQDPRTGRVISAEWHLRTGGPFGWEAVRGWDDEA